MSWDDQNDLEEPFEIPSRAEKRPPCSDEFAANIREQFRELDLLDGELKRRARELVRFWREQRREDTRRFEDADILEQYARVIAAKELRGARAYMNEGYSASEALMAYNSDPWYWKSEESEYADRLERWADRVRAMGHDPDEYVRDAGMLDEDEEE